MINTSVKQFHLYYFEAIEMTSEAQSNFVWSAVQTWLSVSEYHFPLLHTFPWLHILSHYLMIYKRQSSNFGNRPDKMCAIWGGKSNWTEPDRTGLELSCSHCTGSMCSIFVLVWQKKPSLESKRVIMRFCSKNVADPLNNLFTLGAEHSRKLSNTERITFGIGALQFIIVTKIVPDQLDQV